MKKIKRLLVLCVSAMVLLTGCVKFGTAVSEIIKPYTYKDKQLSVSAVVTDDGGCDYYMEQGFCFRQDTFPNLNDVFTKQVIVNTHSEADTFSATFTLPIADSSYWVCAYVKNSAGLSYSKAEKVSTHPEDYPEPEEE